MGLGRITGTRDLDDQHLLLVQAMQGVVEAINPGGQAADLPRAWMVFQQVMEDHLTAEDAVLRFLPKPLQFEHRDIHQRLLDRTKAYQFTEDDPHHRVLRHLFADVQAHMHGPEEEAMVQMVRHAVKEGLLPGRN